MADLNSIEYMHHDVFILDTEYKASININYLCGMIIDIR